MKPRKVLVTLTMKTFVPPSLLRSKKEWEKTLRDYWDSEAIVEKVDAIRIKESK